MRFLNNSLRLNISSQLSHVAISFFDILLSLSLSLFINVDEITYLTLLAIFFHDTASKKEAPSATTNGSLIKKERQ